MSEVLSITLTLIMLAQSVGSLFMLLIAWSILNRTPRAVASVGAPKGGGVFKVVRTAEGGERIEPVTAKDGEPERSREDMLDEWLAQMPM